MLKALHAQPLKNEKSITVCRTLSELVHVNFDYFFQILQGCGIILNVIMANESEAFLSDFPALQKLSQGAVSLLYCFQWKRLSILIVSAAFLSIFL